MKTLSVAAKLEALDEVLDFVGREMEEQSCSMKVQTQVAIAVEEIFVNIARYAYNPKNGEAVIHCDISKDPLEIIIQFMDNGTPYNPLEKEDPDITQSVEQRDIGGLGIFMVKKSMDAIDYCYEDGKNILTIRKTI